MGLDQEACDRGGNQAPRLCRQILRSVPQILSDYKLTTVPVATFRDRIATEWRAASAANGDDVERIDRGIFRAAQELEETLMMWKTPTHVYRYMEVEKVYGGRGQLTPATNSEFLDKFYSNSLNQY